MTDPVHISCACGADEQHASEGAFDATPGTMFIVEETLASLCPDCETVRELVEDDVTVDVADSSFGLVNGDAEGGASVNALVELARGGGIITQSFRRTDVLLSREDVLAATGDSEFARESSARLGLDPDREGFCPDCGAQVLSDHLRADGNAPEIGWEYYECAECAERMAKTAPVEVPR